MKKLTLTTRSRDREFASLVGKVVSIKSGRYTTDDVMEKVRCFRDADEKAERTKMQRSSCSFSFMINLKLFPSAGQPSRYTCFGLIEVL